MAMLKYVFSLIVLVLGIGCQEKKTGNLLLSKHETVRMKPGHTDEFPCFIYHRFGDDRYPSTNISIIEFQAQLAYLSKNKYNVLSLGEAMHMLENQGGVPEKTVVLTIDDGFKTFYTKALPLLQQYKYKATLFINTESLGGKDYMLWEEVLEAAAKGIEIGNHTHTHSYFLNKPQNLPTVFKGDVAQCQQLIEKKLKIAPEIFAYPFGEFNQEMKEVIMKLGFKYAMGQYSGVIYSGSDRFALPRFPMGGSYATLKEFKEKIRMKALRVNDKTKEKVVISADAKPEMQIVIKNNRKLDLSRMQCFIKGGNKCNINITTTGTDTIVKVTSETPLKGRRINYTLTAPSSDNKSWYWYTHLWINPKEGD